MQPAQCHFGAHGGRLIAQIQCSPFKPPLTIMLNAGVKQDAPNAAIMEAITMDPE